jgi:hypothetical protein
MKDQQSPILHLQLKHPAKWIKCIYGDAGALLGMLWSHAFASTERTKCLHYNLHFSSHYLPIDCCLFAIECMLCFLSRWLLCWLQYELDCHPMPCDVSRSPSLCFGVNLSTTKAVLNVFSGWHSSDGKNEGSLVARGWFGVEIGRGWWLQTIIVNDVVNLLRYRRSTDKVVQNDCSKWACYGADETPTHQFWCK